MCELQLRHTIILDLPAAATTVFPWCRPRARNAALSLKRSAQVWDVGTGQVIRHLKGFGMKVNSLLFAQDSTLMIGGSDDRSVSNSTYACPA
jgi:WD40 repeat protein